jgi:hypothetical protein
VTFSDIFALLPHKNDFLPTDYTTLTEKMQILIMGNNRFTIFLIKRLFIKIPEFRGKLGFFKNSLSINIL